MELQIAVEELSRALYRAQGIVEKKSTMPILANVLLDAKKGTLTVTAFDLEIGVQSEHAAEVLKEGKLAVSAKHLYDIVRSLSEASVVLKKTQNNYLELRSGASHFRIVGMPAEDFPALPKSEKVPFVAIDPKVVLAMIDRTSFAVSSDETRFNLNGVYFEPAGGAVRMVATDGHRLALVERPVSGDFQLKRGVIIPKKGLFELKRLLAEDVPGDAQLGFADNSGVFHRPGLTMVMRLIDGHFPDYQHVLPKESDKQLRLGRLRFLEVLKRVSLLSQDQMHTVKLEIGDHVLKVTSQNPDLGEAHEEMPIEGDVAPLAIGFNARYLIDVLNVIGTDEVVFELNDDLSPGVVRPAGDPQYTAVVMPVRI
jgi:DNA polymerase-3 subunit beta